MKGNVCGMTHKKSMKVLNCFFFLLFGGNKKKREKGDKESLKRNALVPN